MLPVFLLSQFLRMSLQVSQRSLSPPPLASPHSWLLPAQANVECLASDKCHLLPDWTEISEAILGVLEWPDPDWDLVAATLRQLRDLVSHSINLTSHKGYHITHHFRQSPMSTCLLPRVSSAARVRPWWAPRCRAPGCSCSQSMSQRLFWIFYFPDIPDQYQDPPPLRPLKPCLLRCHYSVAAHFWKRFVLFRSKYYKFPLQVRRILLHQSFTKWSNIQMFLANILSQSTLVVVGTWWFLNWLALVIWYLSRNENQALRADSSWLACVT